MRVTVVGLGKLGLPSAACLAWAGHDVIGLDTNVEIVAALNVGKCPIREPDLVELLATVAAGKTGTLTFTTDVPTAVKDAEVILIIVPTPSGPDARFENKYVAEALGPICVTLRARLAMYNNDNKTFIDSTEAKFFAPSIAVIDIVSTVMPGSCEKEFRQQIEGCELRVPVDVGLVYNPEFIALGSVIKNFCNPDMLLIGESDERSGKIVESMYQALFAPTGCTVPFMHMSLTDAEITKLCLNVYLSLKIGFANVVGAEIVPLLGGTDPDVVLNAIGADKRIGPKLLKAGMGSGGPCLPRDLRALAAGLDDAVKQKRAAARQEAKTWESEIQEDVYAVAEYPADIAALPGLGNTATLNWHYRMLDTYAGSPVLFLGVSYKPGTHVLDESKSLRIVMNALEAGRSVMWHDPHVESVSPTLDEVKVTDLRKAILAAGSIFILTPHIEYTMIDWHELDKLVEPGTRLFDCWRLLKKEQWENFTYYGMGFRHCEVPSPEGKNE